MTTRRFGAVSFLWHYPSTPSFEVVSRVYPTFRTPVTRHPALWSSDFPPPTRTAGSEPPPS